ncbi:MAG: MoaD family protein, partial [Chloroflexi bacterium]|nr:MoaD family protein [Chloroflexota bacterium]
MPVSVYIPTSFRKATGHRAQIVSEAVDVAELLVELQRRFPDLAGRLTAADGSVYRHVNVYVNERCIESLSGTNTPLKDGDEVAVIPAMAGGQTKAPVRTLTEDQVRRYHRHLIMPEVGAKGQRRLLNAKVLLIGAGGL